MMDASVKDVDSGTPALRHLSDEQLDEHYEIGKRPLCLASGAYISIPEEQIADIVDRMDPRCALTPKTQRLSACAAMNRPLEAALVVRKGETHPLNAWRTSRQPHPSSTTSPCKLGSARVIETMRDFKQSRLDHLLPRAWETEI